MPDALKSWPTTDAEETYWKDLSEGFMDSPDETYLNTGSWGVLHKSVFAALVDGLEKLESDLLAADKVTAEHGWSVPMRVSFAKDLESGFASGGQYSALWERDLPTIRATYPDLDLKPQMGLVPIVPSSSQHWRTKWSGRCQCRACW